MHFSQKVVGVALRGHCNLAVLFHSRNTVKEALSICNFDLFKALCTRNKDCLNQAENNVVLRWDCELTMRLFLLVHI